MFPSTVKLWRALYSVQGLHNPPNLDPWLDDYVLDMFARLTEDYEEDKHLIPKDRLVEMRYEDFVKDPVASMRDIYQRLDIPNFEQAEAPMREFLGERSEHKVSRYELPPALKRKVIDRLKPYIDRFGYRAAVEASPAGTRGEVAGARARAVLGLPERRVGHVGRLRARCLGSVLLSVLDGLDLDRHRVHHIDDRLHLEFENRKHAGEIMNVCWTVRLDDHVAAVVADPDHELMHRKTRGHFPIFVEYPQDAFLRGFVVFKGGCRTLAPADNVFHEPPLITLPSASRRTIGPLLGALDEMFSGAANRSPFMSSR